MTVDAALAATRLMPQRHARVRRLDVAAWPPTAGSMAGPTVLRNVRWALVAVLLAIALATISLIGSRLFAPPPQRSTSLTEITQLDGWIDSPIIQTLSDGQVLIGTSGTENEIAVVLDPRTGQSRPLTTGYQHVALQGAAVLPNGDTVLIGWQYPQGGLPAASQVWVLGSGSTSLSPPTQTMESRWGPHLALLPDGRVAIFGGVASPDSAIARPSVEWFDGASRKISGFPSRQLSGADVLTAVATGDGRILIVGDFDATAATSSVTGRPVTVFDPVTGGTKQVGEFRDHPHLASAGQRMRTVVPLHDGRFLWFGDEVAPEPCGRHGYDPVTAQVFDPRNDSIVDAAPVAHAVTAAAQTTDGRIVVAGRWQAMPGGCASGNEYLDKGWLGVYDPATGLVAQTQDLIAGTETLTIPLTHWYAGAAALPDGSAALLSGDQPTDGSLGTTAIDILSFATK
jgi:hypothetical protein